MSQRVSRQTLAGRPEVLESADAQGPQRYLIVTAVRQVFERNALICVPVFDWPRGAARGVGELACGAYVGDRQTIFAVNTTSIAHTQGAGVLHFGRGKAG